MRMIIPALTAGSSIVESRADQFNEAKLVELVTPSPALGVIVLKSFKCETA